MDQDLKEYLDTKFAEQKAHLVEQMRGMQTELLRGFQAFSVAHDIRVRKLEVDQSNLDAALSGRVNVLENRLMQIELRLGLSMLPPTPPPA
jgi:hypothetical protein